MLNIKSSKVRANFNVDTRNCENKLGLLECKWINFTSALSFHAKIAIIFPLLLFSSFVLQSCLLPTNLAKIFPKGYLLTMVHQLGTLLHLLIYSHLFNYATS